MRHVPYGFIVRDAINTWLFQQSCVAELTYRCLIVSIYTSMMAGSATYGLGSGTALSDYDNSRIALDDLCRIE
jgi:hypothetical protein